MRPALRYLETLLLALWVGGFVAFAAVMAPTLFRVLGSHEAAKVVREIIPVAEASTLVTCAALISLTLWRKPKRFRLKITLLVAASALAAVSAGVITPRMSALRAEAQDRISDLPKDHPTRRSFGAMHGVSNLLFLGQLLLALGVLGLPRDER